jgi:hypothetical protein
MLIRLHLLEDIGQLLELGRVRRLDGGACSGDKDGLLPSKRNTICVLDQMRESKPPQPTLKWKKPKKYIKVDTTKN